MTSSKHTKYYLDSDGVVALLKKLAEFKQNVIESVNSSTTKLIDDFKRDVIDTMNTGMSGDDVDEAFDALTNNPETTYDPTMPTT